MECAQTAQFARRISQRCGREKSIGTGPAGVSAYPEIDRIGRVIERSSYNDEHIRGALALKLADLDAVRKAKFKVVVDAVNSVGGVVIPKLLREMGVEVVELNARRR